MESHAFVSYVHKDAEDVARLCGELQAAGVRLWVDRDNLQPGVRWKTAIRRAIRDGSFFIACFSDNYFARDRTYMNEELTLAIDELRTRSVDRAWFISLLLSPVEIPDRDIGAGATLADIQHVDLYENWQAGVRRLIAVLKPDTGIETADDRIRAVANDRIEKLIDALDDDKLHLRGSELSDYGIAAVWQLAKKGLTHESYRVRWRSACLLGEIGPDARDAVPALIATIRNLLRDGHLSTLGRHAINALGLIGDQHAAPFFIEIMHRITSEDGPTVHFLEDSVLKLGKAIAPALRRVIAKEQLSSAKILAARFLAQIDTASAPEALSVLRQGLLSTSSAIKLESANAAFHVFKLAQPIIPELVQALSDPSGDVRVAVADALGRIGCGEEPIINALHSLEEDEDKRVRSSASHALSRIREKR